jgi:hypothetical protein
MEGVCGGDFVKVAAAIEIDVERLRNCRLQRMLATKALQTAPCFNLVPMNRINLLAGQKVWFGFQ